MSSIWQFFTLKHVVSYLVMVSLLLAGLYSVFSIKKESAPEIQIPIAVITTVLPGASPSDVENLVTNEIEQAVQSIENVDEITSTSRTGVSSVVVNFEANADLDVSIQDVKDQVDLVRSELPEDAADPVVNDVNFADQPILFVSLSSDSPKPVFKNLTDDVVTELERISGVARVEVTGLPDREITVIVEPEALNQYSLTLADISNALRSFNTTLPVGDIEVDGVSYALTFAGDLESAQDVGSVPIATPNGSFVYLRDIALIADGLSEPTSLSRVSVDGQPSNQAVTLFVFKQRAADILSVTGSVKEKLAELEQTNLANSDVVISFDAGENIKTDLINLSSSGAQTVVLVLLVLLIFLGWREAVVAALAIPLSFFIAFIGLFVSGNTINFISLFSLILSIGILVDSAIVLVEGIHSNMKADLKGDKREAALKAIREYHFPVTTGTLTTVAFFAPLFTVSGITGKFLAGIPFTVIFVLIASLIVALAFIPLIASRFLHRRSRSRLEERQEALSHSLQAWYKRNVAKIFGHKKRETFFITSVIGLFFFTTVGFFSLGLVTFSFFPDGDESFLYVDIQLPQGTPLEQTDLAVRAIEEVMYEYPVIESFTASVGQGSNFNDNSGSGARLGSIDINLREDRAVTSLEFVEILDERLQVFPQYEITVGQPSGGPPSGAPIVITFKGDDLGELNNLASAATRLLEDIEGTRNVSNSAQDDSAEFILSVDRDQAAELGVTPAQVAGTLRTAVFGTEATTIKELDDDIEIMVKLNLNQNRIGAFDTNQTTIDRILELPLNTPQGTISLGSVLSTSFDQAQERIRHEDLERIASVSSNVESGISVAAVNAEFDRRAKEELTVPANVTMQVGGETEDVDQSTSDMFRALIFGIFLAFAVVVIQFNSIKQSLFIISIIPLALIGVMTGLAVSGLPLSLPAMLGFIALAGIVINNAIILIDVINGLRQERPDEPLEELILEGATRRLRPILLTTITTIVGISPLIWVSAIWAPIAFAIIFGLLFAVVLTLIWIPIMYRRFHERSALFAFLCMIWRGITWPYRLVRNRFR